MFCAEVIGIELTKNRYNFDNKVSITRIRSPTLEGQLVEYCLFVSTHTNHAKSTYVVAFRGIKHDEVKFTEGNFRTHSSLISSLIFACKIWIIFCKIQGSC